VIGRVWGLDNDRATVKQTANSKQQTANSKQQTATSGQPSAVEGQRFAVRRQLVVGVSGRVLRLGAASQNNLLNLDD
jgi:hypothetical protein